MSLRKLHLLLLVGVLFRLQSFAQDGEAKVYFVGIGIEQCINGTPGKAHAVNDVNLVSKRTQNDALDNRSYNFNLNSRNVLIRKFTSVTLFNDNATLRNIDSVFAMIAVQAKPTDVFYLYISAQPTDSTGSFIVPASPAAPVKKGKSVTAAPTREVLLSKHLNELCGMIKCANQILVANSEEWSYSLDRVKQSLTRPPIEHRNQVLVYPTAECTDSVLVEGKQVSWLAGSIYKCESSMFLFLLRNDRSSGDVVTDLNFAFYDLTHKRDRYIEFADTWKNEPAAAAPPDPVADNRGTQADPDELQPTAESFVHISDVKNYALIIANEEYKYWSKLGNPVHDGEDMEKELRDFYGYEVRFVKNIGVDSMYAELRMLAAKKLEDNYQVMFYYAGHGGYDHVTGEGFIVPIDAPEPHCPSIMSRVVSYGYLLKILDNLAAQHVMVMLDACYSGAFNPQLGAKKAANKRGDVSMESMEMMVNNSMQTRSRCYMTSGKLNTVPDGNTRNSPFAAAILKMLRDNRQKEKITTFSELKIGVMYLTSNPQDGVFGQTDEGDTGEYFFFPASMIPKKK